MAAEEWSHHCNTVHHQKRRPHCHVTIIIAIIAGAEVGVDLSDRFNFSVLTAPNRSDIPPEAVLRYQATDKLGVQGALDQQGRWQGQLQLFFRF